MTKLLKIDLSRIATSKNLFTAVYYLVLFGCAVVLVVADVGLENKVFGIGLIFFSIVVSNVLIRTELVTQNRIAQTYPRTIDPVRTFPEYDIPPQIDKHAMIRFECARLVDCAIPILFRELDKNAWKSISTTHALDVELNVTSFNRLFDAVDGRTGNADVVIASAAAVDRATYKDQAGTQRRAGAPICLLPILQQFNAYFIFAKRAAVLEYLRAAGDPDERSTLSHVSSDTSLDKVLATTSLFRRKPLLEGLLQQSRILVERGADLDSAFVAYWEKLANSKGTTYEHPLNFDKGAGASIQETFLSFLESGDLTLYLGGLAQTAYLLNQSGPDDKFVVIARPDDVGYENINSFVCSRELAERRGNELLRLYGWWFDLVNRFRRDFLFDEVGQGRLADLLRRPVVIGGRTVSFLPEQSDGSVVKRVIGFLSGKSSKEIGSFLLPNMYAAANTNSVV